MDNPFAQVDRDFLFFLENTDEIDNTIVYYQKALANVLKKETNQTLLEYGPGSGQMLAAILKNFQVDNVDIVLIEPDLRFQQQCQVHLGKLGAKSLTIYDSIFEYVKTLETPSVDIILSNHVFYYVPQLQEELTALFSVLKKGGVLFTSLVAHDHPMVRIYLQHYEQWDLKQLRHTPQYIDSILQNFPLRVEVEEIHSTLKFVDSEANRLSFIRFLTVEPDKVKPDMAACLDDFQQQGHIEMPLTDLFHVIRFSE